MPSIALKPWFLGDSKDRGAQYGWSSLLDTIFGLKRIMLFFTSPYSFRACPMLWLFRPRIHYALPLAQERRTDVQN